MERYFIPADIAKRYGVNCGKVLGWIRNGSLSAVNTSDTNTRPRWRISPQAVADFEEARSNKTVPAPRVSPKRKPRKEYV